MTDWTLFWNKIWASHMQGSWVSSLRNSSERNGRQDSERPRHKDTQAWQLRCLWSWFSSDHGQLLGDNSSQKSQSRIETFGKMYVVESAETTLHVGQTALGCHHVRTSQLLERQKRETPPVRTTVDASQSSISSDSRVSPSKPQAWPRSWSSKETPWISLMFFKKKYGLKSFPSAGVINAKKLPQTVFLNMRSDTDYTRATRLYPNLQTALMQMSELRGSQSGLWSLGRTETQLRKTRVLPSACVFSGSFQFLFLGPTSLLYFSYFFYPTERLKGHLASWWHLFHGFFGT